MGTTRKTNLPEMTVRDIDPEMIIPAFRPYLFTISRYTCWWGGSGSGKSFNAMRILAVQMTFFPGRNLYCMRRQAEDCYDSCFGELQQALVDLHIEHLWHITESPHRMRHRLYVNEIRFGGLDKIENIKSVKFRRGNVTDILYEEASEEDRIEAFYELDRRLRDKKIKCRLFLIWNPTHRDHCLRTLLEQFRKRDLLEVHTTYKDNIENLTADYIQQLEEYKIYSPYDYQVYTLGEWGTTGATLFNREAVGRRLMELEELYAEKEPKRVDFAFEYSRGVHTDPDPESFREYESDAGASWIFVEPKEHRSYTLSLDTAGETSQDRHAAHVMDDETNEQVAVFHSDNAPEDCVFQILGLCRKYNNALFVPEINFSGSFYLSAFKRMGYDNIYQRMQGTETLTEEPVGLLGFNTNRGNRSEMIFSLVMWLNRNVNLIHHAETLHEALSFVRRKKAGRVVMEAEPGTHDDLIMALAINLFARKGSAVIQSSGETTGKVVIRDEWDLEDEVDEGRMTQFEAEEFSRKNLPKHMQFAPEERRTTHVRRR